MQYINNKISLPNNTIVKMYQYNNKVRMICQYKGYKLVYQPITFYLLYLDIKLIISHLYKVQSYIVAFS